MARKQFEKYVIDLVDSLDPSGFNKKIYIDKFSKMTDKDVKRMVEKLESTNHSIRLFSPLDSEVKLDFERNVKLAEKLGFSIYQKLVITRGDFTYTPEINYCMLYLPIRRASQHVLKNFNVHKHRKTRNRLTGAVAGNSASGKLTLPEIQVMKPLGLKHTLNEFLGIRGGDIQASNALNGIIFKDGNANLSRLQPFITKTGATKTLKAMFKAMHMDLTI